MFASEHKGFVPTRADSTPRGFKSSGEPQTGGLANTTLEATEDLSNWICWKRPYDKVTGLGTGSGGAAGVQTNITYSGLAKYLGTRRTQHDVTDPGAAHNVSATLEALFTCPSDNIGKRNSANQAAGQYVYRYSYAMNDLFAWPNQSPSNYSGNSSGLPNPGNTARDGFVWKGKLNGIKNSSERIMYVCHDEAIIASDGAYRAAPYKFALGLNTSIIAARHSGSKIGTKSGTGGGSTPTNQENQEAVGNVAFADGHVGKLSRKDGLRQQYTGSPYPDPVGF
jgi:prepilin-type processing-associated H-X9-DG protein